MSNDNAHSELQVGSETGRQGRCGADAAQIYAGLLAALDALEVEFRIALKSGPGAGLRTYATSAHGRPRHAGG